MRIAAEAAALDNRWERFEPRVVSTVNPGPVPFYLATGGSTRLQP